MGNFSCPVKKLNRAILIQFNSSPALSLRPRLYYFHRRYLEALHTKKAPKPPLAIKG